jgi:hypothetical protein
MEANRVANLAYKQIVNASKVRVRGTSTSTWQEEGRGGGGRSISSCHFSNKDNNNHFYFLQIHNESETTLRDIETRLNNSYNIAVTSYRSIMDTYQNATRLHEEVKEAEGTVWVSIIIIVLHCIRCMATYWSLFHL